MATDEVREGLQLVADGLEGLEQGRLFTDEQRWRLLKANNGLQDADRAMRVKLSQMGDDSAPRQQCPCRCEGARRRRPGSRDRRAPRPWRMTDAVTRRYDADI